MSYFISYKEMQASYENFKKAMPLDPVEKFVQQLNHVRNLISCAKLQGLEKDVFEYQKVEQESLNALKQLGLNIK